jgi:hypothetical protein
MSYLTPLADRFTFQVLKVKGENLSKLCYLPPE